MERVLVPSPVLTAPETEPPLMVTVSLPLPEVSEPTAPAPELKVRVLVPAPRLRLPVNEPVVTVAVSPPLPRAMLSMPEKVTLPRVPPPAPVIEMLLPVLSDPATLNESVPLPPLIVMVDVEALLTVKASVPSRPLMVSKLEKVVLPPLLPAVVPAPVPVTVMVLSAASRLRVSVPLPPTREVTEPPLLMVAVSLPSPRSTVPLKAPEKVAVSALASLLAPRLMFSKALTVRLVSRVVTPPLATEMLLTPALALRVSLPLPPTKFSKPLTAPVMAVAPAAAVEVAELRLTVTALA